MKIIFCTSLRIAVFNTAGNLEISNNYIPLKKGYRNNKNKMYWFFIKETLKTLVNTLIN